MDSILQSVKKYLGIPEEYTHFDQDLLIHIQAPLLELSQIGVGPIGGLSVMGPSETWTNLYGSYKNLSAVRSYVCMRVRLSFDPPTSQALIKAINDQLAELIWRLRDEAETLGL